MDVGTVAEAIAKGEGRYIVGGTRMVRVDGGVAIRGWDGHLSLAERELKSSLIRQSMERNRSLRKLGRAAGSMVGSLTLAALRMEQEKTSASATPSVSTSSK